MTKVDNSSCIRSGPYIDLTLSIAVMTAATLLREKARKFKLILNTRMDDEVTIAQAVEEMVCR